MDELCIKFEEFVRGIWADPKRRTTIVSQWNCRPFNGENTISAIFSTFILNILNSKCVFRIDTDRVWFIDVEDLAFPLSWFTEKEKKFLILLVTNANFIFSHLNDMPHGGFEMSGCLIFNEIIDRYFNRLLIVKEFALSVVRRSLNSSEYPRPDLFLYLKKAATHLMLSERENGNFNPKTKWTRNLRAIDKALKGRDVVKSLIEIEVMVI